MHIVLKNAQVLKETDTQVARHPRRGAIYVAASLDVFSSFRTRQLAKLTVCTKRNTDRLHLI